MTQDDRDLRKSLQKELERLLTNGATPENDIEKLFDERVRSRFGRYISQTILAERRRALQRER
jgi:hypothetical protein